jgi:plastocyanin
MRRAALIVSLMLAASVFSIANSAAEAPATGAFLTLWQRTDLPVAVDNVQRSWLWGDQLSVNPEVESYKDSPGGVRVVQYFDKGRMEITDPQRDQSSPWYVTSGLLTRELVTGKLQLGDDTFDDTGQPAHVPVAGDPTNTFPTYADLAGWIDHPAPDQTGQAITAALTITGMSTYEGDASDAGTVAAHYFSYTGGTGKTVGYNIPQAFWTFMNQSGPVYIDGQTQQASPLFQWEFVLGYPIGEALWCNVSLAGKLTWVMVQPFERRVLTYTPSNPENWRVEMGNIGQHYHTWRYQKLSTPVAPATVDLGDFYYSPSTLTVHVGTRVVWTVSGQRTNSVTADDGSWESGDLTHGDLFTHEFDQPGTYRYHSRYYAWMKGTIIVTAGSP